MRKIVLGCFVTAGALALAGCDDSDDASDDNMAETVEMPAQEALEPVEEAPVADAQANASAPVGNTGPSEAELEARAAQQAQAVEAEADESAEAAAAAAADVEAIAAEAAQMAEETTE